MALVDAQLSEPSLLLHLKTLKSERDKVSRKILARMEWDPDVVNKQWFTDHKRRIERLEEWIKEVLYALEVEED